MSGVVPLCHRRMDLKLRGNNTVLSGKDEKLKSQLEGAVAAGSVPLRSGLGQTFSRQLEADPQQKA
eukprot:4167598-Alexandrium_andersonii.AAC.1